MQMKSSCFRVVDWAGAEQDGRSQDKGDRERTARGVGWDGERCATTALCCFAALNRLLRTACHCSYVFQSLATCFYSVQ